MKYHHLDFPSALKDLARRYQIDLPEKPRSEIEERQARKRQAMFAVNEKCADIYRKCLLDTQGTVARRYLQNREIGAAAWERFRIGYAPSPENVGWEFITRQLSLEERQVAEELGLLVKKDGRGLYDRFRDRVLFPILDTQGRVIGFGGRILGDGQPKYMNSPESPVFNKSRSLLGLYQQGDVIRRLRQAVIVEGNFDMVALVESGVDNVVAPLGTALTREQLRLLHRFAEEVVFLFDGDSAGMKAAMRAVPLVFAEQMTGKVALLPPGHDPDTFVRQEGVEALREIIANAHPLPEFILDNLIKEHGLGLDGKMKIVQELKPLVEAASSPLQRSVVLAHFSEKLGFQAGLLESFWLKPGEETEGPRKKMPAVGTGNAGSGKDMALSAAQRHIVSFMMLHPVYFPKLVGAHLREYLQGTIGEILFLQMESILAERGQIEPEELLSVLPDGDERGLAVDILQNASRQTAGMDAAAPEEELKELLDWVQRQVLQQKSFKLQQKILDEQERGNRDALQLLVKEKQEIDRQLQDVDG